MVAAYVIGIVAASWHFSYGMWLFAAKWGFTVGDRRAASSAIVCAGLAVILVAIGIFTIRGFLNTPPVAPPSALESPYDTSQVR